MLIKAFSDRDVERIKENIGEHDDDMLKITRTLQKQIDEKEAKIGDYRTKIQQLSQHEESARAHVEKKFESEKSELMRKQKDEDNAQEEKIEELQNQEQTLLEFKNTQMIAKKQRQNLE